MAFFPAPGVAQLVLSGQYGGSEAIVNVLHVQRKNDAAFSPWTQQELRNASMRLSIAWQRLLPFMMSEVAYNEIKARDLSTATSPVDLFSVPLPGTRTGTATPPSVTYLIQWRTGTAGKGANGRSYLPGVSEGDPDALGRLSTGFLNTINPEAQGIITDLGAPTSAILPGVPLDLVVLHKPGGQPLARTGTKVITGRFSNLIATQRRRLPKRA